MGALPVLKDLTPALSLFMGGITEEERRERRQAVDFANASIGLEGFKITVEEALRSEQFVAGELSLEQYVNG